MQAPSSSSGFLRWLPGCLRLGVRGWLGVGVCLALGLGLAFLRLGGLGTGLVHLSFDIPFLLRTFQSDSLIQDLIIVELDEKTLVDKGWDWNKPVDRRHHAELLRHLTADMARMVVFDIFFEGPSEESSDALLAEALAENGRVVLAGASVTLPNVPGQTARKPYDLFATNAANWGLGVVLVDHDLVVRRHHPGHSVYPTLAWAAAQADQVPYTVQGSAEELETRRWRTDRWMNYYPSRALRRVSYTDATGQSAGFYEGKVAFVGARAKTGHLGEEKDEFASPLTRFNGQFVSGVEIQAIMFLNLIRGDWLRRLPPGWEILLLLVWSVVPLLLFGAAQTRGRRILGIAVAMLIPAGLGVVLFAGWDIWFAWLVPSLIQTPIAFLFAPATVRPAPSTSVLPLPETLGTTITVPNHSLIRCVGQGAYGEVWLARNQIDAYCAVKFVDRAKFDSDVPYEREFRGIKKYMPISHAHPALLRITFVGRDDDKGCFFYIMEAADDVHSGPTIDPESYQPRTLATELRKAKRLSLQGLLDLALKLTDALEALHHHDLIHRDIKPANVVYVAGVPKLADIGLVTEMEEAGAEVSYLGTEGYIPPEGPGKPSADIFALGRILYSAWTGLPLHEYPNMPDSMVMDRPNPVVTRLNDIILKACEADRQLRYRSVAEMKADLQALLEELEGPTVT